MKLPQFELPNRLVHRAASPNRLTPLAKFGSNPGALNAWVYLPAPAPGPLPLVVVLHGCTQSAAGYDNGSGWSKLAEAYGFAVLFPEQVRANNANLCFNWFEPDDTRRGHGEALSIAQMIDALIEQHGIDGERTFITGLSAGGAMTSTMLALYPEKFAGGAILAGLPHGAAAGVQQAFQQMRSPRDGTVIKSGSAHAGPWPTVSIWHGTADTVVSPRNADAIVAQWQDVHGLTNIPPVENVVDGYPHRGWHDADGRLLVEEYRVTGMGHGTPLATQGECGCGEAGAFMLEVGISSTVHSARTWGLLKERRTPLEPSAPRRPAGDAQPATHPIGRVIEDALRSAGLMR